MPLFCYEGASVKNQRATNMDCLLVKETVIENQRLCLAVICDGVGSLDAGAYAASSSVKLLNEWFDGLVNTDRLGLQLRNYILEINKKIKHDADEMKISTASTISALLLDEERYYIVHLGDSRIYAYRDGDMVMLTRDHVKDGKLASCVGHFDNIELLYNEGTYDREWFLLCSDGLYKRSDPNYIAQEMAKLKRKNQKKIIDNLISNAIAQGEKDNISVAIVSTER